MIKTYTDAHLCFLHLTRIRHMVFCMNLFMNSITPRTKSVHRAFVPACQTPGGGLWRRKLQHQAWCPGCRGRFSVAQEGWETAGRFLAPVGFTPQSSTRLCTSFLEICRFKDSQNGLSWKGPNLKIT